MVFVFILVLSCVLLIRLSVCFPVWEADGTSLGGILPTCRGERRRILPACYGEICRIPPKPFLGLQDSNGVTVRCSLGGDVPLLLESLSPSAGSALSALQVSRNLGITNRLTPKNTSHFSAVAPVVFFCGPVDIPEEKPQRIFDLLPMLEYPVTHRERIIPLFCRPFCILHLRFKPSLWRQIATHKLRFHWLRHESNAASPLPLAPSSPH